MYNSVKELHIALDVAIQKIQSQQYRTIQPEEKDFILNSAVEEYITTRTGNQRDTHHIDFVGTLSRLDELSDIVKTKIVPMLHNTSELDSHDYWKLHNSIKYIVDGGVLLNYNACHETMPIKQNRNSFRKQVVIKLNESMIYATNTVSTYYLNYEYTVDGAATVMKQVKVLDLVPLAGLINTVNTVHTSFTFRASVLELLNNTVLNIPTLNIGDEKVFLSGYYEYYNNEYTANTYYIVLDYFTPDVIDVNNVTKEHIVFTNASYNQVTPAVAIPISIDVTSYYANGKNGSTCHSPIEFVTYDKMSDVLGNTVSMKNRYKRPLATLQSGYLKIVSEDYYHSVDCRLTYIKQPKQYNYITNTMCELQDTEGILRIAVKLLESYLLNKDVNSQQIQEKNSLVIN